METSSELISARIAKINSRITGKVFTKNSSSLIARECLLDALQALYDECSLETLQKCDKNVLQFYEKFKNTIQEVKKLRVNASDFDVRSVIGRGHFGEVHVVVEKQSGDVYAMKTIRKCDSLEKTSFDVERDIMAFSTSPWLTSLQYAFQDTTCLFFIMDYHPGGDLLGLLYRQGGTLPESAATFYIAQLISALEDLHLMGYVHRDIKPDNVLLDRCGHVKLADFGSAARLNSKGLVNKGPPVGTPDYVAPEVLQSLENSKNKLNGYGVSCDFWSLGIVAYELTTGKTPFAANSTSTTYARITSYSNNLKFPSDVLLTQSFVSFVKLLIIDEKSRPTIQQIKEHSLFKNVHFDTLRDQVPPYVPKITSPEDTANFSDVMPKKTGPSIENFKRKTHFSGRNLPFVGFTFTHDLGCERRLGEVIGRDEVVKRLKEEVGELRRNAANSDDFEEIKFELEFKLQDKTRRLESIEAVRENLEKEFAACLAENNALRRTLEIERKDRTELERKALDLIRSAKAKWETSERTKVEALNLQMEEQNDKIAQLMTTNEMLNEQLERAFKSEEKHRRSIEAVEVMSRRSVIGLESRLDKMTQENKTTIAYLQKRLNEELNKKHDLEKEIGNRKNEEEKLLEKLRISEESYDNLKSSVDAAETIIRSLNAKINELDDYMRNLLNSQSEVVTLTKLLEERDVNLRDLDRKNVLLQSEVASLRQYKNEIEELRVLKAVHEKRIAEIESQLTEEKKKCVALKQELENSENLINETQELRELRTKLWRTEKDLSNSNIDKRILERELKDAEIRIKQLIEEVEMQNKKLNENKTIHENAMLELSSINETLSLELVKAKESCKSLGVKLANEKEKNETEKSTILELKEGIRCKERKTVEMYAEIDVLKKEKASLQGRMAVVENEMAALVDERNKCKEEAQRLRHNLDNGLRQIENSQLNWEALREACTLLEGQVVEYERIVAAVRAEKQQLSENTEKLISDVCEAKRETQEARKMTNEEKSLRLLTESKVRHLNEEINDLKIQCTAMENQCSEYKECCKHLTEELEYVEEQKSDLELHVGSCQRQITALENDVRELKEEISRCLTQVGKFKEANRSLKHQLNELKEVNTIITSQNEDLHVKWTEEVISRERLEVQSKATIQQQTKLINFLQIKVDEVSQKKRSFAEKIFGHSKKENQPPPSPATFSNCADLKRQLQKQRQINTLLEEELYELKTGTTAKELHKMAQNIKKIVRHNSEIVSPKQSLYGLIRQSSARVTSRNLPEPPRNLPDPPLSLPDSPEEVTTVAMIHQSDPNMEGWVQVLSKTNTWERRYACLTDTHLCINTAPIKDNGVLLESFELKPFGSRVKVLFDDTIENNSETLHPLKIVVTPKDPSLPSSSFVFVTFSIDDRLKWFEGIETILGGNPNMKTIATLPADLRINCLTELTRRIKLIGCDDGLYCCNENLFRIDGVSKVYRILVLSFAKKVLMIVGDDRRLIACDLDHLINLTQCASFTRANFAYSNLTIANLDGFQFLEATKLKKQHLFCAATPKQLVIVKYDSGCEDFVALRVMDTAQPVGCVLFTEHSLIVGADKLFEIDLHDFKAEEFLDGSDTNLAAAVKCGEMKSFPLEVAAIDDYPKEFLLCFKELTVMVDEYGRFSRECRIDSDCVPVAFRYVAPFLYVVHLYGVQVLKLGDEIGNSGNVQLNNAKYVGDSEIGIYVYHENKVKLIVGKWVVQVDSDTSVNSVLTDIAESDRFSFTSSIVQSLDGNLSDGDSIITDGGPGKKVTFSQTNL